MTKSKYLLQLKSKAIQFGVYNLTNEELLLLLLHEADITHDEKRKVKRLLKEYGIGFLDSTSFEELVIRFEFNPYYAGKIMAISELLQRSVNVTTNVVAPIDIVHMMEELKKEKKENLVALYLNARHEIILKKTIAIGNLNKNIVSPIDIFYDAVKLPSLFFILVHNHPSGDSQPSAEDLAFTKRIIEAGYLIGCSLVDHIIVAQSNYYSLKENGQI